MRGERWWKKEWKKKRDGKRRERSQSEGPRMKSVNERASERESDRKSEGACGKVDTLSEGWTEAICSTLISVKLRIPEEGTFTADAVKGSGREGKSGYGRQMALNTSQYKAAASRRWHESTFCTFLHVDISVFVDIMERRCSRVYKNILIILLIHPLERQSNVF